MIREIKFRIWDKTTKEMIFTESRDSFDWIPVAQNNEFLYGLMQYTGLKDKNGKEIYEGDILIPLKPSGVWIDKPIEVQFKEDTEKPCGECSPTYGWNIYSSMANEFEIIGNIYENTELLNEEELSECCSAQIVNSRCFDCKDNVN